MSDLPLVDEPVSGDCAACGLPIADGDAPSERNGTTYCCDECAEGFECACTGHNHAADGDAGRIAT